MFTNIPVGLSGLLSSKNGISFKKSTSFEIVTQTIPQVLFLKTTILLLYMAKCFMHASYSITEYKKNISSSIER